MTTPTDPLYGSQWHFPLLGDIETIWDEFSGAGVSVGVYDDGVDYNHVDLDGNYDASLHALDDLGNAIDPFPVGDDAHGTACAGLIGAESNNGTGGTGVASGVTLTGVNIFNSGIYGYVNAADSSGFMDVAGQATNFDISSNSWGSTPSFGSGQNINDPLSFAGELHSVYADVSANGRGGLGTIITQAAGNDTLDANGSGTNSSRYTITVAASDEFGNIQDYSNFGTSVLVTAPAGAVTTDVSGAPGYDAGDYTTTFGGTSAATPVTSGVIALMLEANDRYNDLFLGAGTSELGWRDVQNILAISASETGSGYGNAASGFEVGAWGYNSATNWNGGGMAISGSYGFGMVDAYAATRMAEVWSLFDVAQTSANEAMVSSNTWTGSQLLPDGDPTGIDFTLTVGADIAIEHIELSMGFNTTWAGDLSIIITTPDGTTVQAYYQGGLGVSFNDTWTFGIDHLLGETSAGTWTINVADNFGADANTITSLSMDIYGQAIDNNDVYHYTNDFLTLAALDASRLNLADTNGGADDWLNLAAVGTAGASASINLTTGEATATGPAGPVTLQLLAVGHGIEHVVGGDGNETITGDGANNSLLGQRGDDTILGGAGEDVIDGGVGNDVLSGGADNDEMYGWDGDDVLNGNNGNDVMNGEEGNDTLNGQGNADRMYGNEGNDSLFGGAGFDSLYGGIGIDNLNGGGGNDYIEGGTDGDIINGVAGSDEIYGGDGYDSILGGNGFDTVYGDNGFDIIDSGLGNDTVYGGNGNDTIVGNAGSDDIFGGINNDRLEGQGGNDELFGEGGADELFGGVNNDTLDGGFGTDVLTGGTGADDFVFVGNFGNDTVTDFLVNVDDADFSGVASINSFAQWLAASAQVGADVVTTVGANTVTFEGVTLGAFDAADFIF